MAQPLEFVATLDKGGLLSQMGGLGSTLTNALGIGAGAGIGMVVGQQIVQGISDAFAERTWIAQMANRLGGPEIATAIRKWAEGMQAGLPFDEDEISEAIAMLYKFGATGKYNFMLVADAAAANRTPLSALSEALGRLAGGQMRALMQVSQMLGMTAREWQKYGVTINEDTGRVEDGFANLDAIIAAVNAKMQESAGTATRMAEADAWSNLKKTLSELRETGVMPLVGALNTGAEALLRISQWAEYASGKTDGLKDAMLGLYEVMKRLHPELRLFGFLGKVAALPEPPKPTLPAAPPGTEDAYSATYLSEMEEMWKRETSGIEKAIDEFRNAMEEERRFRVESARKGADAVQRHYDDEVKRKSENTMDYYNAQNDEKDALKDKKRLDEDAAREMTDYMEALEDLKSKGQKAQFESLTASWFRIQGAAASTGDDEEKQLRRLQREHNRRVQEQNERRKDLLERIADSQAKMANAMANQTAYPL